MFAQDFFDYCTVSQIAWIPRYFSLEKRSRFGKFESSAKYLNIRQVIDRILTREAEARGMSLRRVTAGTAEAFVNLYPQDLVNELKLRVESDPQFLCCWRKP